MIFREGSSKLSKFTDLKQFDGINSARINCGPQLDVADDNERVCFTATANLSMVFRQCFRLGDGNIFIAHVFLVFYSADEEKKHVYALEYFVDVWFFSLLQFSASLLCNFCRRLISLRNYLLRLMSAQLMSLTAFKTRDVFAQLLSRLMSAQLMSLTTSTSIDTIARNVQSNSRNMPDDNELRFFRDE